MANKTFSFTVDDQGKFDFLESTDDKPPIKSDEWRYNTGDAITFASPNGPFVMELLPIHSTTSLITPAEQSSISPFEEFANGEKIRIEGKSQPQSDSNWIGKTVHPPGSTKQPTSQLHPRDPLEEPAFQLLLAANNGQFVTRYRYAIVAHSGDEAHLSTERNGSWAHPC